MSNPSEKGQLFLQVGDQTEELLKFITSGLEDEVLDGVEVTRINHQVTIASEPITVGVILVLGGAAIYATTRLLEKWVEVERQKGVVEEIKAAWDKDPRLGMALVELAKTHSGVVVSQGMPDIAMIGQGGWEIFK